MFNHAGYQGGAFRKALVEGWLANNRFSPQCLQTVRAHPTYDEFWKDVNVTGGAEGMNHALERAGRVADFLEFGELLARDALERRESCGGHFREEYQTEEGEALRDDENFSHVAVWAYRGLDTPPERFTEPLKFEVAHPDQRSYK